MFRLINETAHDKTWNLGGGGGGVGWGRGGNLGVRGNFRTGVRASISKPTPFIYLAFEKNPPIHILDHPNCWPIHILPFDFLNPFFAGYYINFTVNSYNTKRISSLQKSLSEKYVHIPGCQKNGAFHIGIQKNRAIHILFVEKRGPIIYLAALKKGAIPARTSVLCHIYRKLPPAPTPPTPPPPHPTHTHTHEPEIRPVWPTKTQISLYIHPVACSRVLIYLSLDS